MRPKEKEHEQDSCRSSGITCCPCGSGAQTASGQSGQGSPISALGGALLGATGLTGLSWSMLSAGEPSGEAAPPRRPLVVKTIFTYPITARRPMASLSGGESFLASLALALGLSDLAGRTVRIDSLFVDEGFGSLDAETLEVAIAALESLRQDHKQVGVISHVELLKERIGTQIVVEKRTGGTSQIRVVPEDVS